MHLHNFDMQKTLFTASDDRHSYNAGMAFISKSST